MERADAEGLSRMIVWVLSFDQRRAGNRRRSAGPPGSGPPSVLFKTPHMSKFSLGVLSLGLVLCGSDLAAQALRNVKLMSSFRQESRHNDIWGWHDPTTGREAAILGGYSGVYIVETTNPSSPVRRGYFAASGAGWSSCTWSDMKAWKGYAYIVTECGGGMEILDLRNLNAPKYVGVWGTQYWSHAHNIAMDLQKGIAIVHGTGRSSGETVRFVDVDTTPGSPRLLASWSAPYEHDLSMQNGLLHGAEIYAGRYTLYDVSNLNAIKRLGSVQTPRAFTHNTWPTYDDKYCVTTDERSNGPMAIYDISSRGNPVYRSQYHAGPSTSIIHNAYVLDYVAHISHYTEGYRCVDISDPKNPVEVGYYDDYGGSSSGYSGHWGCYCFQPSGIVYASSGSTGLLVLKPRATAIRYGTGTAGTGNVVPRIHTIGSAYIGNSKFQLGVRDANASSPTLLVLGGNRGNINFGGLTINVDLINPPAILLGAATNAQGALLVPLPIANDPGLNNLKLDAQFFVADSNGKAGFSGTQGLELEIFSK